MYRILLFILFLLFTTQLNAQMFRVSGKVIDSKTEYSISSLSIVEDNFKIGTISNNDGSFWLLLKPGKIQLSFSHEQYEPFSFTFELKSDTIFKIKLNPIEKKKLVFKFKK